LATDSTVSPIDHRYVVVARRYRPKSFSQLVGQQHVGQALCNAIETNRVGHAYLFTGARGVGKTSTARIFAKALNDPGGPTCDPDGTTDTAQAIDAGEDVDVIEIDGASNRGIDEIRSLRANVGVRPSRSRYKIYIIDEVHMLTGAAFNALLKTLEEPPSHVKFIFCTTDPEKIPITVLSRCQRFDFSPVKSEEIMGRLREIVTAENVNADDEALRLIARRADGSMRDSQSLLEQVISFSSGNLTALTVQSMLGAADDTRLHAMATTLAAGDAAQALRLVDAAAADGIAVGQFAEQLLGYFRDLIAVTVGCPPDMQRHTSESLHDELRALGVTWGIPRLLAIVGMIDHTLVRIRHTVHGRVLLESTLVQICHLPDLQSLADLTAAVASGASISAPTPTSNRAPVSPSAPARPVPVETTLAAVPPEKKNVKPSKSAAVTPTASIAHVDSAHQVPPLAAQAASPASSSSVSSSVGKPAAVFSNSTAGGSSATMLRPAREAPAPSAPLASSGAPVLLKTRIQRQRDMESHAYVKSCLEMFDGEIIRIDNS